MPLIVRKAIIWLTFCIWILVISDILSTELGHPNCFIVFKMIISSSDNFSSCAGWDDRESLIFSIPKSSRISSALVTKVAPSLINL